MNLFNSIKLAALTLIISASAAFGQLDPSIPILIDTNAFFNARDTVVEFTPNISSSCLFNNHSKNTFGFSMEFEYWQTLSTGTGFELGNYDLMGGNPNIIDHLAVMEDYRIVPFKNTILLNRFAVVAKSGVETFLSTGQKDIEVGLGINYAITRKIRAEADFMEHFGQTQFTTLRAGLQWLF